MRDTAHPSLESPARHKTLDLNPATGELSEVRQGARSVRTPSARCARMLRSSWTGARQGELAALPAKTDTVVARSSMACPR